MTPGRTGQRPSGPRKLRGHKCAEPGTSRHKPTLAKIVSTWSSVFFAVLFFFKKYLYLENENYRKGGNGGVRKKRKRRKRETWGT